MTLDAGKLRHRIEIQAPASSGQDSTTGEETEVWQTVSGMESVPASIEPLSARDFVAARAEQSEISARIVIRYRPGFPSRFRIRHRGLIYWPAGALPDPESGQEWMTIPVGEGVRET